MAHYYIHESCGLFIPKVIIVFRYKENKNIRLSSLKAFQNVKIVYLNQVNYRIGIAFIRFKMILTYISFKLI